MNAGKDQIWGGSAQQLLAIQVPSLEEELTARPSPFAFEENPILVARNHEGNFTVLFPILDNDRNFIDDELDVTLSSGFHARKRALRLNKADELREYLEIRNSASVDVNLFGAVADEILNEVDGHSVSSVIVTAKAVIERWKRMLSMDAQKLLPLSALIGLAGELMALHSLELLLPGVALRAWTGPNGSRHDFEFPNRSIEVKTSSVRNSKKVSIHGTKQLIGFENRPLEILFIQIELDPAGVSIVEIVHDLLKLHSINNEDLIAKLVLIGFHLTDSEKYQEFRFQWTGFSVVPIGGAFPKITQEHLSSIDPLRRIDNVSYDVEISGMESQITGSMTEINWGQLV